MAVPYIAQELAKRVVSNPNIVGPLLVSAVGAQTRIRFSSCSLQEIFLSVISLVFCKEPYVIDSQSNIRYSSGAVYALVNKRLKQRENLMRS